MKLSQYEMDMIEAFLKDQEEYKKIQKKFEESKKILAKTFPPCSLPKRFVYDGRFIILAYNRSCGGVQCHEQKIDGVFEGVKKAKSGDFLI